MHVASLVNHAQFIIIIEMLHLHTVKCFASTLWNHSKTAISRPLSEDNLSLSHWSAWKPWCSTGLHFHLHMPFWSSFSPPYEVFLVCCLIALVHFYTTSFLQATNSHLTRLTCTIRLTFTHLPTPRIKISHIQYTETMAIAVALHYQLSPYAHFPFSKTCKQFASLQQFFAALSFMSVLSAVPTSSPASKTCKRFASLPAILWCSILRISVVAALSFISVL